MPLWLFAFFAALALISALGVVVQSNPVHCLLSLVVTPAIQFFFTSRA